jgi:branched-chain amino acid transport system substrate-binding protein
MASSEVKNIKSYVTANKMIIISPSSTALPSLLGFTKPEEKKYIFRFVPNDEFQGKVIASEIQNLGFKKVLVLFREDAWGKGLKDASVKNLKKEGIAIIEEIGYPSTPEPSDWSPYIEKMSKLLKGASPKDTAILAIGFEELATLLSQIKADSSLLSYKWFGSDGVVNSQKVLQEAKEKAVKVKLYSTVFYSVSPEAKILEEEYQKKGYGKEVTQYPLCAYDGVWVAAVSYADMLNETGGKYDADLLAKKIRENVKKYSEGAFGVKPVTGDIVLNEWNDRASGNYAIRVVTPEGWKLGGVWDSSTGKITWKIK